MTEKTPNDVELSLVIPAYNEQETIKALLQRISEVFKDTSCRFEVIIVDDGSADKTLPLLKSAQKEHPWLRVLTFDRNHGQTAAMSAGFRAAQGHVIATLDADLQNDPAEVPRLMGMLGDDVDAVVGWRQKRQDPWLRKVSTKIANGIRNWLSSETIHDSACSLKVYKRCCLERLTLYEGMHRFMPTLVKMQGYHVIEVPISHHPRYAGQAKYGVWNRVFKAFFDLLAVRWMKKRWLHYKYEEIR
jgi:glycosyltransferase involved in cell wall biosynthesis